MRFSLDFFSDNKAQISAEMIIVMAALLGIAVVVITKLTSSASKSAQALDEKTDTLVERVNDINF